MRIIVAAVGRLKHGPETELSERYRKRTAQTGRQLGLRDIEIIEIRESRATDVGKRMIEESIALANVIPDKAAVVLLDSRGDSLESADFATQLAKWRANGRPATVFLIGGADGLAPNLRDKADLRVAFGSATSTGEGDAIGATLPRNNNSGRSSLPSSMKFYRLTALHPDLVVIDVNTLPRQMVLPFQPAGVT